MGLGAADGHPFAGASVGGLELAFDPEGGLDFGAPIRLAIGPGGQHQPDIGGEAGRLVPGDLRSPLGGALGQEGGQLVRVRIGCHRSLEGAGGDVQRGAKVDLTVGESCVKVGEGEGGRVPGARAGDLLGGQLVGLEIRQMTLPVHGVRFEPGPPGPVRVCGREGVES